MGFGSRVEHAAHLSYRARGPMDSPSRRTPVTFTTERAVGRSPWSRDSVVRRGGLLFPEVLEDLVRFGDEVRLLVLVSVQ